MNINIMNFFLNNLKFFSYEEPNDTITISKYLLKEEKEFKKIFDFYTEIIFFKAKLILLKIIKFIFLNFQSG